MQESIFVKIRDTKIHIIKKGSGFPIFILHGGPGMDHISLGYRLDLLMDQFCLLYVDLRGHGQSESVDEATLTVKEMAQDISEMAKELGYEKYAVIGHSFGAFVALQHAVDYADENMLTILLNGAKSTEGLAQYQQSCMGYLSPESINKIMEETNQAQARFQASQMNFGDLDVFIREIVKAKLPLYFPISNGAIDEFMPFFEKGKIDGYILNLMANNNYGGYDLTNQLHKIKNKVLIISGDKDYICDPKISQSMSQEIRNSKLHIVKNAGHYPFFDNQEETVSVIREFLNQNK